MSQEHPATQPLVGAEIAIKIDSDSTGNGRTVRLSEFPEWRAKVFARTPRPWVAGEELSAWVAELNTNSKICVAYLDDFGRLPISDRMRPRYLEAVTETLAGAGFDQLSATARAEIKGMFDRIERRDQWDWFSVSLALKIPTAEVARRYATVFSSAGEKRKRGARGQGTVVNLSSSEVVDLKDRLANAATVLGGVPNVLTRATAVRTPRPPAPAQPDERDREHDATLAKLRRELTAKSVTIEQPHSVDVVARLTSGPALFEIAGIHGEDEPAQGRAALSRLYEYRFREKLADASLWIVFSREPKVRWMVEYFEHDRDVRVIWFKGESIAGPSAARLHES